jgi:hypothetical protein
MAELTINQLQTMLHDTFCIGKFFNSKKHEFITGDDWVRLKLYTKEHYFSIVATATGYLGCTMSNRYQFDGEDWLRGCDLADGKLNLETARRIMLDIISYELDHI